VSRSDRHVAAAALLRLSKKVQNGTATVADAEAVPAGWRGYLVPQPGEASGPKGERCFTDLLADLRRAVTEAIAPTAPLAAVVSSPASWGSALVVASHVWSAPVHGSGESDSPAGRTDDDVARARLGARLPERPFDGRVRVPHLVLDDFDMAMPRTLREVEEVLAGLRPARTWDELLGMRWGSSVATVPELFQVALAVAVDRFTIVGGTAAPVAAFMKLASATDAVHEAGLCEEIPGPVPCFCRRWLSRQDPTPRQLRREARRGLAALRIAAWQLAVDVVEAPPVPLERARGSPPSGEPPGVRTDRMSDIGALCQFLEAGVIPDEDQAPVLLGAAAELDAMQNRPTLRVASRLVSSFLSAVDRSWGSDRRARSPVTEHAVAQLVRSAAGAFRELREPVSAVAVLSPWEQTFEGKPPAMKIHEGRQDVQLAFQRAGLWTPAARAFAVSLAKMDLFFEDYRSRDMDERAMLRQKGEEVREQHLLGRVGGLVQEAEELICAGQLDAASVVLAHAVADLDLLHAQLQVLELDHFMANDRPGPAGFLRFDQPWAVMPSLMRYRVSCAGVLASQGDYQRAKAARGEAAEQRRKALSLQRLFTLRHHWELQRIDVVAALWNDDLDFEHAVELVVAAGGDDGVGDYVLPVLRWAVTVPSIVDRVTLPVLEAAIEVLRATDASQTPRLPDLRALQPSVTI
jgi:hypothetical protein